MQQIQFKFILILIANLVIVIKSAPSLPKYDDERAKIESTTEISYAMEQQPQEEYYAGQFAPAMPVGLPKEVSRFEQNPTINSPLLVIKQARKAITSSAEMSDNAPSVDDKKDLFVINPAPLTQFILPPKDSVVPNLAGSYIKNYEKDDKSDSLGKAISNPAAYYLEGSKIEDVKPPKCQMMGCNGPVPNDYDIFIEENNEQKNKACHQAFVPLNSCTDKRGYPIGMICTICCDCTAELIGEMKKSRGYVQGYKTK